MSRHWFPQTNFQQVAIKVIRRAKEDNAVSLFEMISYFYEKEQQEVVKEFYV